MHSNRNQPFLDSFATSIHHTYDGNNRRVIEEIVGAYRIGQEIMGHKKHHGFHVVAEGLVAIAAAKKYTVSC